MTNYDRMRNASEDDWNSLALSRDMYKKWLLNVWMKKDYGSEKEEKQ